MLEEYDELILKLRNAGKESFLFGDLMRDAADTIEKLVELDDFLLFLWGTIQPNEMEQYISMYRALDVPQEPPKEET